MIIVDIFEDGVCISQDDRWLDSNIWGVIASVGACPHQGRRYWRVAICDKNGHPVATVYADAIRKGD